MAKKQSGLSPAELSSFCGQIALILEAGLPLYDGMETLAEGEKGTNAELYQAASRGVTETGSLYDALREDGRWPAYLVEMVGIGERSGHLEQVMHGLEAFYAREERIRSSVVSAITYPLVLGIMLVLIVFILLWKVMPVFRRVMDSMGVGLTETGAEMMRLGSAVGWIVMVLVALLVLAVVVFAVLNRKLSAARVSGILSMMLSSGFPVEDALDMTGKVLTDKEAADKVNAIRGSLDEGKTFADAVSDTGLFDELHSSMIRMGAATGHEDQVLGKLSGLYEEQVEEEISRLISIIEPSLVALLAVVIGAVLLSVLLPMAGILSSL